MDKNPLYLRQSEKIRRIVEEKLLLYMTSGFHDRDNSLNIIILCILKCLYRLIKPNATQAYSAHCKAAHIYMESTLGILLIYGMQRHIFLYTRTHIIISRTKQYKHRKCKFKIHLQAIYTYVNTQLWLNEFSIRCRIAQLLPECQRTSPALNSIITISRAQ